MLSFPISNRLIPRSFLHILRRPSADEQRLLEVYFGAARLERLRRLALSGARRGPSRGNAVVLHGIMGGQLTVCPQNQASQSVWLDLPRIAIGALGWLRMTPELGSQFDVRATGILKKWYSEMLLDLAADRWNVQAFWYDWRLDLAKHCRRAARTDRPVVWASFGRQPRCALDGRPRCTQLTFSGIPIAGPRAGNCSCWARPIMAPSPSRKSSLALSTRFGDSQSSI